MTKPLPTFESSPETTLLLNVMESPDGIESFFEQQRQLTDQETRFRIDVSMPPEVRFNPLLKEIYWREHLLAKYIVVQLMAEA